MPASKFSSALAIMAGSRNHGFVDTNRLRDAIQQMIPVPVTFEPGTEGPTEGPSCVRVLLLVCLIAEGKTICGPSEGGWESYACSFGEQRCAATGVLWAGSPSTTSSWSTTPSLICKMDVESDLADCEATPNAKKRKVDTPNRAR